MRKTAYVERMSHDRNVRTVRFHDDWLFSLGGEDRCIFQWKVTSTEGEPEMLTFEDNVNSEDEHDYCDDISLDRTLMFEMAHEGPYAIEALLETSEILSPDAVVIKPWVASAIPPTTLVPVVEDELTKHNLILEWVNGYSADAGRNNVVYALEGKTIAFPAATLVVLYDKESHSQRFFRGHSDTVLCVAVHPKKDYIMASSQMGRFARVFVWDANTCVALQRLDGHQRRGVSALAFDPTHYLATVGQDPDHILTVYDWSSGTVMSSASADSNNKVTSVAFQSSSTSLRLITAGQNHLTYWSMQGGKYLNGLPAALGQQGGLMQHFPSIAVLSETCSIIGTANGQLYLMGGRAMIRSAIAHVKGVSALHASVSRQQVCSGGKDGLIKLWSHELDCLVEFNIEESHPKLVNIRAVHYRPEQSTLIVGTRSCEIFELSSVDGKAISSTAADGREVAGASAALLSGHCTSQCWGLAVHPVRDWYATTGDDAQLCLWNIRRHVCMLRLELDAPSRAAAFSPDGTSLAVGLGSGASRGKHKKDGTFRIYALDEEPLQLVLNHEARDTKQWITALAYSPDGSSLVVGSFDHNIYIYEVIGGYIKRATFSKHKSAITHLDLSLDGQYMRSTCGGFELFYSDVTTGSHVASASALKNQEWATTTCVFNYSNQGLWPHDSRNQTSITTTGVSCNTERPKMLVSGDNFGNVQLVSFPYISSSEGCKVYTGHVSDIRSVVFSQNDSHVLTLGGSDRCIFQWRHQVDESQETAVQATLLEEDADVDLALEGMFATDGLMPLVLSPVKPYLSAMIPPSTPAVELVALPPPLSFKLTFVHGYRSDDVRNNVRYSSHGRLIVYHTAALGIIYDQSYHTQRYYTGHVSTEIISLTVTRDGRFVASGEAGPTPSVHIWDSNAGAHQSTLPRFHERGITAVGFNPAGTLLATVGLDAQHSLCVYHSSNGEWDYPCIVAHAKTSSNKVLFVQVGNDACTPTKSVNWSFDIVTGGVDHVLFWTLKDCHLLPLHGIFGNKGQIQPIPCAALVHTQLVTGTSTGHLYVWKDQRVVRAIPAHVGTVNALHATTPAGTPPAVGAGERPVETDILSGGSLSGGGLVSGGRDGHVKVWNASFSLLFDFDMEETARPSAFQSCVRSVQWDTLQHRILVGTRSADVYELSILSNQSQRLVTGHYQSELSALAVHPINPDTYATGGDDCTLRIWSISDKKMIGNILMDTAIKSIVYAPDGKTIAVGFGSNAGGRGQRKDGAVCRR